MTYIAANNVTKRYGETTAVDDLTFEVEPGEIVGLLGANGAGKTTAMKMLLGLEIPSAGHMTMMNQPVYEVDRRTIGYVPQGLGLYAELTVGENLEFVAAAFGVDIPDLGPSGLAEVSERSIGSVSLGIRRRVAFLAATCHSPKILILDEPTSGVGPLGRARLWETIHSEGESGAAVLVSTHFMDEAEECDRVVLLANGRAVMSGGVSEIVRGTSVVAVSGDIAGDRMKAIEESGGVALLSGDGWRVVGLDLEVVRSFAAPDASVTAVPATFEEVFVSVAR